MATTELGKKFIIMSKIPGENGEIAVNESNIKEILYQMGENLGLLHTNRKEGTPGHKERLRKKVVQLSNILKEDQTDIGEEYEFLQKACNQCANLIDKLSFDDVIFGYGHGDFGFQNIMVQDNILTGIFDFEMSGYTNTELDLIQIYRKHLYANPESEKAFFGGYCNYMLLPKGFNDRKNIYMMLESIINCSWSFNKNRDYYNDNIKFLEKILL